MILKLIILALTGFYTVVFTGALALGEISDDLHTIVLLGVIAGWAHIAILAIQIIASTKVRNAK